MNSERRTYLIRTEYRSQSLDLRAAAMEDHLGYVRSRRSDIRFSGPFLEDDGVTPNGGLTIIDCANRQEATDFADHEPFLQAGVLSQVGIRRFVPLVETRQAEKRPSVGSSMFACEWQTRVRDSPANDSDSLVVYGDLCEEEGPAVIGGFAIVETPDIEAALRAIASVRPDHDTDPSSIKIDRWRYGIGIG